MARDYVPDGQQCVAAYLLVADAPAEIAFLERVFDAEVLGRTTHAHGGIHAEVRIDDTVVMIGQPPVAPAPQPAHMHVYVPDVERTYERALAAGAANGEAPAAQAYGDRRGSFTDPAGHRWWIATRSARAST